MKLNKIGEVRNSANRLLSDFIGLLSSKNFATMATTFPLNCSVELFFKRYFGNFDFKARYCGII